MRRRLLCLLPPSLHAVWLVALAFVFLAAQTFAAIVPVAWKVGARFILYCVADTTGDLPTSPTPPDGAACAVKADNLVYTYNDGSWAAPTGGGGDSFKTLDTPSGTDPVADSSTDTLTLVCTGATCTGDSATDTLTIAVTGGDPTLAGDVDGLGSANDLDEVAVEAELESVLDLAELQGAVTDGQVPNTITVDNATAAASAADLACANCIGGTEIDESSLAEVPSAASATSATSATTSATATALAADPADCTATQFATAIGASGALSCAALTDADVPNGITVTLAATATALAVDPAACPGGEYATDIAANGTLTCATAGGGSGLTHPQIMARLAVSGAY